MSRDSSGESLEAILASIRRSLAEQATSVLEDEAAAPVELLPASDPSTDLDTPPIPASLSQRLSSAPDKQQSAPPGVGGVDVVPPAAESGPVLLPPVRTVVSAPAEASAAEPEQAAAPDPVEAPASAVVPAPVAAAATAGAAPAAGPAQGQKDDPLWFLSQEAGPRAAAQPTGAAPPPAVEPKPARLGAVRGPLPPFFGSSAEAVKVEMTPDPPALSGTRATPPLTPAFVAPPASLAAEPVDGSRAVNGEALRGSDAAAHADSAGGVRTSSIFGPAPADARAGEAAQPQIQALEAMVAELLRPMLRRWLDENMPRLVSAALQAEADLMAGRNSGRDPGRDPKKP